MPDGIPFYLHRLTLHPLCVVIFIRSSKLSHLIKHKQRKKKKIQNFIHNNQIDQFTYTHSLIKTMPAKSQQDWEVDFNPDVQADSQINYDDAIDYWSSTPATVNGVLGGYGEQTSVPKADIVGSSTFLRKLQTRMTIPEGVPKITIDMGAGIGRITRDLLWKISDRVDLLEPVKPFVAQMENELVGVRNKGRLGQIYDIGMQDWIPDKQYWLIWCQWCVGQLPDDVLVEFWRRCGEALIENGTLIVKENIAPVEDIFDETDSSVTRQWGSLYSNQLIR